MGQAKHILEERRASKSGQNFKTRAKGDRANFVDVRADKVAKNAVGMIMSKYEDMAPTIRNTIADTSMNITIKFSEAEACWIGRVCDVDAKWPNITYYSFRHADIAKLIIHMGYVLSEQWKGVLPTTSVSESDLDW